MIKEIEVNAYINCTVVNYVRAMSTNSVPEFISGITYILSFTSTARDQIHEFRGATRERVTDRVCSACN